MCVVGASSWLGSHHSDFWKENRDLQPLWSLISCTEGSAVPRRSPLWWSHPWAASCQPTTRDSTVGGSLFSCLTAHTSWFLQGFESRSDVSVCHKVPFFCREVQNPVRASTQWEVQHFHCHLHKNSAHLQRASQEVFPTQAVFGVWSGTGNLWVSQSFNSYLYT